MAFDDNDADSDTNSKQTDMDIPEIAWSAVVNSTNLGFDNPQSQNYFQQCFLAKSMRAGLDYLVMRSSSRTNLKPQDYIKERLPLDHSKVQLRIAHLSFLLTKGETELVLKTLEGSYHIGCKDGFACAHSLVKTKMAALIQNHEQFNLVTLATEAENLTVEYRQNLVTAPAYRWSTRIPKQHQ